jgi:hypothetical protein
MKKVKINPTAILNEINISISKLHLVKFKTSKKSDAMFNSLYDIENELRILIERKLIEVAYA